MSEIGTPSRPVPPNPDQTTRVSAASTTSDQGAQGRQAPERQSSGEENPKVEKNQALHDPAVALSAALSGLEEGSRIRTTVQGLDGENRPVIQSDRATYVVTTPAQDVPELTNIQPNQQVELTIQQVDKEIQARITRISTPDEATLPLKTPIPVTLTLVSVDVQNQPTGPLNAPPPDISDKYQATTLYKAESLAREISQKLEQLPLPTSTQSYTIYQKDNPAAGTENTKTPPSSLQANSFSAPLLIQDTSNPVQQPRPTKTTAEVIPADSPPPTAPAAAVSNAVEQLIQKVIPATIVKTIPQSTIPLPAAVQKEIGQLPVLTSVTQGSQFSLTIQSIAVPEAQNTVPPSPQSTIAVTTNPEANPQTPVSPTAPAVTSAPSLPQDTVLFSGIVVDPKTKYTDPQVKPDQVPREITKEAAQNAAYSNPVFSALRANDAANSYQVSTSPQTPGNSTPDIKSYYLATPDAVVRIESPQPLVPGTVVSFSATPLTSATSEDGAVSTPASSSQTSTATIGLTAPAGGITPPSIPGSNVPLLLPLDELIDQWPALNTTLASVVASVGAGSITAETLSSRLPTPNSPAQMTSSIVFFLAALGAARPAEAWLGRDVTQALKNQNQMRLIRALDQDMQRIRQLGVDTPIGEWRPLMVPFQSGQDISALPLLIRHNLRDDGPLDQEGSDETDDRDNISSTRFMLDVSTKQLGRMLLDGLLKPQNLDIIVKSEQLLSDRVKTELTDLYEKSLARHEFTGGLTFREGTPIETSVRKMVESHIRKAGRNQPELML